MKKKATIVYVVIRVLVYGFAISITTLLLPGISIKDKDHLLATFLLLGAIFGLIHAFIRPFVLTFTGRFVIATMGIGVVLIDAALLLLLGWLSFGLLEIDGLVPAIVGAVIMALVTGVFEILLGLTRPVSPDDLYEEPDWWGLDKLSRGRRNRIIENIRMQQVYNTIWRYGIEIASDQTVVGDIRAAMQRVMFPGRGQVADETTPAKVRMMLEELGPTYVKLGQMVSSRSEALPPEWRAELDSLQSDVPPFDGHRAVGIVEEELGAPIDELYATFDIEPIAAASLAQVHHATLPNGEEVAVKVQRPDIEVKVKADLGIMTEIAETLEKRTKWASDYDIAAIVEEFADNVMEELDYKNEAYNARRLAENLSDFEMICVPAIHVTHSTSRVLTMEFVRGVKITDTAAIDAAGLDRPQMAHDIIGSAIKQLLFDGFFHGDPHPGNVLVNLESARMIMLDMGMMGVLESNKRLSLADLILALRSGNPDQIAAVLVDLSVQFKPFDEKAFRREFERMYYTQTMFSAEGAGEGFSQLISGALGLMYQHGLRLDPDLTLAIKALTQFEEISRTLDPEMSMVDTSFEASRKLLVQQLNTDTVSQLVQKELMRTGREIVRRLPSLSDATLSWLDQYQSGKLTLYIDSRDLSKNLEDFGWGVRQLAIAVLLVAILFGSASAMESGLLNHVRYAPTVLAALFLIALFVAFLWVFKMVREVWKSGG